MSLRTALPLLCLLLFLNPQPQVAQDQPAAPGPIVLRECLVLPRVGRSARSPVRIDPLEALIIQGTFKAPKAGDAINNYKGEPVAWEKATADDEGWISGDNYGGAYAFWSVECVEAGPAILNARGHTLVYANGELRYGDPYNTGYVKTPVMLRKGVNEFLFLIGRGRVKAQLEPVSESLVIGGDWTLPDFVVGQPSNQLLVGAVHMLNTSTRAVEVTPLVTATSPARLNEHYSYTASRIPPLAGRKVPFAVPVVEQVTGGEYKFQLELLVGGTGEAVAKSQFTITAVEPDRPRKVTFVSHIDGSVQYYGLRPAKPLSEGGDKPGIVLSLHGASVEAIGQARAYGSKSWCHIVAPTNRRPFGFDWEDWGRLDALEVLGHAKASLEHDPTKVWLTGHSMGGHGTWTVGAHFPDRFAAIAPSAGWESFWSYSGGGETYELKTPVTEILDRSANPSRTLLHKNNYRQQAIYILHGDADDNVPVSEARDMRAALKDFHTDLQYFEQPGANHWWDAGHDDGADCVDWQPIFDTFARRRLPHINEVQSVDFTTVCPEHSADCHWARIEMQQRQLAPSRVQLQLLPNKGVFEGNTENVARLSLQLAGVISQREAVTLKLDGGELQNVAWPTGGRLHLRKGAEGWEVIEESPRAHKGPHRGGWFKNAFNHEFLLVYGTQGSAAENAWSYQKARFDAEQWWVRGNGAVEIVADNEFDPKKYPDRGVVLYGNADSNGAFAALLNNVPVRVGNGAVSVGERKLEGADLAVLFTFPRLDSAVACVAVVGGTGLAGMRVTDRIGYFTSGASFPDLVVYGPEMLSEGAAGVRAAGFFGEDWTVDNGEFAWREK
ncbi:MAG: prolyl oligopeptidase family serine peptidase [Planctomycetes bacterium]|nr:prolyl oligopeptidase family serine peptidase [Planctomycetota bacterium]